MYQDGIGFVHLCAAMLSVVSGSLVLALRKGTRMHTTLGFVYVAGMMATLASAFMIYRFYGRWGLFHYLAVVSSVTILLGMIPMFVRRSWWRDPIKVHFRFMYWSVGGLYAALAAELLVRVPGILRLFSGVLPKVLFHYLVLIITGLVILVFAMLFRARKRTWVRLAETFQQMKQTKK